MKKGKLKELDPIYTGYILACVWFEHASVEMQMGILTKLFHPKKYKRLETKLNILKEIGDKIYGRHIYLGDMSER